MRDTLQKLSPSTQVVGILVVLLLIFGVSAYLGGQGSGIGFIEIMMGGMAILGLVGLAIGDRGVRLAYLGWIFLFVLGYRTLRMELTYLEDANNIIIREYELIIHPLLLLIIFIFVLMLLQLLLWEKRSAYKWAVPPIVWIFSLFWIWGCLVGWANGFLPQLIIERVLNFVILIPIFVVTGYILQDRTAWKPVITIFFIAGAYIAIFGAFEFLVPSSKSLFSGFITNTGSVGVGLDGFGRAGFSFFGHANAAFICMLTIPMTLAMLGWYKSLLARLVILACLVSMLVAIYISGWRSMWAATALLFVLLAIAKRNVVIILLVIAAIVGGYIVAPPEARERLDTLMAVAIGDMESTDSSALVRVDRAEKGIQKILDNPLGQGWSSGGWVHSDVIDIAAEVGIVGSVIFVIWYLMTMFKIVHHYLKKPDNLTLSLLGGFFIVGVLFASQPMYALTQMVAPLWFVWALTEVRQRQLNEDGGVSGATG
jgi:hypothetical protein